MTKYLRKLAFTTGLALAIWFPVLAGAQDETNAETAITNAPTVQTGRLDNAHLRHRQPPAPAVPETLPPEALAKLRPEQIMELEMMRQRSHQRLPDVNDIVTTIAVFGCILLVVAILGFLRHRRTRMLHDTVRLMIEKGTAIPPELLNPTPAARRPQSDLRSGLVLIGIGLGVSIFFLGKAGHAWGIGMIPTLMGVALLVVWKVERNKDQKK